MKCLEITCGNAAPRSRIGAPHPQCTQCHDMDGNMTAAAQALTPADIEALAAWLSTLP